MRTDKQASVRRARRSAVSFLLTVAMVFTMVFGSAATAVYADRPHAYSDDGAFWDGLLADIALVQTDIAVVQSDLTSLSAVSQNPEIPDLIGKLNRYQTRLDEFSKAVIDYNTGYTHLIQFNIDLNELSLINPEADDGQGGSEYWWVLSVLGNPAYACRDSMHFSADCDDALKLADHAVSVGIMKSAVQSLVAYSDALDHISNYLTATGLVGILDRDYRPESAAYVLMDDAELNIIFTLLNIAAARYALLAEYYVFSGLGHYLTGLETRTAAEDALLAKIHNYATPGILAENTGRTLRGEFLPQLYYIPLMNVPAQGTVSGPGFTWPTGGAVSEISAALYSDLRARVTELSDNLEALADAAGNITGISEATRNCLTDLRLSDLPALSDELDTAMSGSAAYYAGTADTLPYVIATHEAIDSLLGISDHMGDRFGAAEDLDTLCVALEGAALTAEAAVSEGNVKAAAITFSRYSAVFNWSSQFIEDSGLNDVVSVARDYAANYRDPSAYANFSADEVSAAAINLTQMCSYYQFLLNFRKLTDYREYLLGRGEDSLSADEAAVLKEIGCVTFADLEKVEKAVCEDMMPAILHRSSAGSVPGTHSVPYPDWSYRIADYEAMEARMTSVCADLASLSAVMAGRSLDNSEVELFLHYLRSVTANPAETARAFSDYSSGKTDSLSLYFNYDAWLNKTYFGDDSNGGTISWSTIYDVGGDSSTMGYNSSAVYHDCEAAMDDALYALTNASATTANRALMEYADALELFTLFLDAGPAPAVDAVRDYDENRPDPSGYESLSDGELDDTWTMLLKAGCGSVFLSVYYEGCDYGYYLTNLPTKTAIQAAILEAINRESSGSLDKVSGVLLGELPMNLYTLPLAVPASQGALSGAAFKLFDGDTAAERSSSRYAALKALAGALCDNYDLFMTEVANTSRYGANALDQEYLNAHKATFSALSYNVGTVAGGAADYFAGNTDALPYTVAPGEAAEILAAMGKSMGDPSGAKRDYEVLHADLKAAMGDAENAVSSGSIHTAKRAILEYADALETLGKSLDASGLTGMCAAFAEYAQLCGDLAAGSILTSGQVNLGASTCMFACEYYEWLLDCSMLLDYGEYLASRPEGSLSAEEAQVLDEINVFSGTSIETVGRYILDEAIPRVLLRSFPEPAPTPDPQPSPVYDGSDEPPAGVAVVTNADGSIKITPPQNAGRVTVEIPVENLTPGTVAVLVKDDGTEEIIMSSVPGSGSISLSVSGSAVIKIVDRTVPFYDVSPNAWYAREVAWAASHGIMVGTGSGFFEPDKPASRAMIAQILFNLAGAKAGDLTDRFKDVSPDDWYAAAVSWLVENGIAKGYGDSFGAGYDVSRGQFAVMLYRFAKFLGLDVSARGDLTQFSDAGKLSGEALEAMSWAVGAGLINGMDDGTLSPNGGATRAQTAALLMRFCEKYM